MHRTSSGGSREAVLSALLEPARPVSGLLSGPGETAQVLPWVPAATPFGWVSATSQVSVFDVASGQPGSNRQHSAWKANMSARNQRNRKSLRARARTLVPTLVPADRRRAIPTRPAPGCWASTSPKRWPCWRGCGRERRTGSPCGRQLAVRNTESAQRLRFRLRWSGRFVYHSGHGRCKWEMFGSREVLS